MELLLVLAISLEDPELVCVTPVILFAFDQDWVATLNCSLTSGMLCHPGM